MTADRRRLRFTIWVVALALGGAQAWIARHQLSSDDAIAYLDIGDAYTRGDWHTALNAYWSPLYSWILGAAMAIARPSMAWEFPLVKVVNLAIFAGSMGCFDFLLRCVVARRKRDDDPGGLSDTALIALVYGVFLWTSLAFIGVSSDTPDMLVAAFTFLAAALVLRIESASRRADFLALGFVLGGAYLAKAAMFPLAFVFLAVAFSSAPDRRSAGTNTVLSFATFAVVAAPFAMAISLEKGRATFGDAGRLNYAWTVTRDVLPYRFWEGRNGRGGTPAHAPRVLVPRPLVFEFAEPVGGTYPPWHDPSYWYEGVTTTVKLDRQIESLAGNIVAYLRWFGGAFVVAFFAFAGFGDAMGRSSRSVARAWPLWVPAFAGLAIYLLATDLAAVHIPTQPSARFVAASVLLLALAGLSTSRTPSVRRANVLAGIALAGIAAAISSDLVRRFRLARNADATLAAAQPAVAAAIRELGIQAADRVAISGPYIFPCDHWARLARVKIVAEIYHPDVFWEGGAGVRAGVESRLRAVGVKAVIQRPGIGSQSAEAGWLTVGSGYKVKVLP